MRDGQVRRRKPVKDQSAGKWFLKDRAISDATLDRLSHSAIATTLVEAVRSSEPPCMIGLLGEFGKGKSSTANLAAVMLDATGDYDPVTVTADKHSGTERARNLVHAIAGKLEGLDGIDAAEVEEVLRPLRQSTETSAPDPTDTPFVRLLNGRYKASAIGKSFLPFGCLTGLLFLMGIAVGGAAEQVLTAIAALPPVVWLFGLVVTGPGSITRSMFKPAELVDHVPRAEAADEIEVVFGRLIDLHASNRTKRKLVIFVDDIDRLSPDDLLDALRSLRSLQSVPIGNEPIFVISCNEEIVRTAVAQSSEAPASAHAEVPADEEAGTNAPAELAPPPDPSDHDHPALAFIDKLLTVRVQMPPTMHGDMRMFALEILGQDHPLRAEPGVDVDQVVAILIHDRVDSPRAAIRVLNRFVASFLLGKEREAAGSVFKGDITGYAEALAQLSVILDEFPELHRELANEPALLSAARVVATGDRRLSPSEQAALERSECFYGDSDEFKFCDDDLRRFFTSTARRVRYPDDLGPLVYFTATPGGRALGSQLRGELIKGVESGDADEMSRVLDRVPSDKMAAAAQELVHVLEASSHVDAATYLASVAPNLVRFGQMTDEVAEACAAVSERAGNAALPHGPLLDVLQHTGVSRVQMLCDRLVRADPEVEPNNMRMVAIAEYLAARVDLASRLQGPLIAWLDQLPTQGDWSLGRAWIAPAERMGSELDELRRSAVNAMVSCLRSEPDLSEDEGVRLVQLYSGVADPRQAPAAAGLTAPNPEVESAFVRLWTAGNYDGDRDAVLLASEVVATTSLRPAIRKDALRLVTSWSDIWVDDVGAVSESDEEEPGLPFCDVVMTNLLVSASDDEVGGALASSAPALVRAGAPRQDELFARSLAVAESMLAAGDSGGAKHVARQVVEALEHASSAAQQQATVDDLLAPLNADTDPSDPRADLALAVLPQLATQLGEPVLATQVDGWMVPLRKASAGDPRLRMEAMRVVAEVIPSVRDSRAQELLTHSQQASQTGSVTPERMTILVGFPWNPESMSEVLGLIHTHWDLVPVTDHSAALSLVPGVTLDETVMGAFNERIVRAVMDAPHGLAARAAAENLDSMTPQQRSDVLFRATGLHGAMTDAWRTRSIAEQATVLATHATGESDVQRLLEGVDPDQRSSVCDGALLTAVEIESVPDEVAELLASGATANGRAAAAAAATESLAGGPAEVSSALVVLVAVKVHGVAVDQQAIAAAAVDGLASVSDQSAEKWGRTLEGVGLPGSLKDELQTLRNGDAASIADAFDRGRRNGTGRRP
jgi:hypothetical protein